MARTVTFTDVEWLALQAAVDDAWYYRLGEADGINDRALDPEDRAHLLQYRALLVAHPELEG